MAMTYVPRETVDSKVDCRGACSARVRQPEPIISLVTTSAAV